MRHATPSPLVRLNLHLRRDHVQRLVHLANTLARKKNRDIRLGEAIELTLIAGFAWKDHDLLDMAPTDQQAPHWLQLGPVDRHGGQALIPATLRC
jgi:hypothetical protein